MSDLPTVVAAVTPFADMMNEVYKDAISPSVRQMGDALAVGFEYLNWKATLGMRQEIVRLKAKYYQFAMDLKGRVEAIPQERLVEPNMRHFGAVIDALPFTEEEPVLRTLFMNLLTASMDCERTEGIHIGFVDCIKQMEPLDAQLLQHIWNGNGRRTYFDVAFRERADDRSFGVRLDSSFPPHYVVYEPETIPYKQIGASLDNLQRLGLIDFNLGTLFGGIRELPAWEQIFLLLDSELERLRDQHPGMDIAYDETAYNACKLTQFGRQFAAVCM